MTLSPTDLRSTLAAVRQGAPLLSATQTFTGGERPEFNANTQALFEQAHAECLTRASIEIFKADPLEWWKHCKPLCDEELHATFRQTPQDILTNELIRSFA